MKNDRSSTHRYPAYKDSGIKWLGKVPEHWEVGRIKEVGTIRYGLSQPPKYLEDGLTKEEQHLTRKREDGGMENVEVDYKRNTTMTIQELER